ncbi:MAG: GH3 family acyl-acid amido synthetase [Planctomycetota bacterium]|jgi:hypothetical protein
MSGSTVKSLENRVLLQLAAHRKERLFHADPIPCQEQLLRRLLKSSEHTVFGRIHGFSSIRSSHQFLARVLPRSYPDLKPQIDRILKGEKDILCAGVPKCFGVTTGSEGEPKLIPLNSAVLRSTRTAAIDAALLGSIARRSLSWHWGKTLYIGPRKGRLMGKWMVFSEGTAFVYLQAKPLRARFVPKYESLPGPEENNDNAFLNACISRYPITAVAGNPLEIVDFVCATQIVMPGVEIAINCGYWATDHKHIYEKAFPNASVLDVYGSNEGIWGLPVSFGKFLLNYRRAFFSFLSLEGENMAVGLEGVEVGRKYRLCVTTQGGLWNYSTGDVVCFESIRPPIFVLCGRYSRALPLNEGWLTENEVVNAVRKAGISTQKYCLSRETQGFVLHVDGETPEAEEVGRYLCQMNSAYKRLRASGRLAALTVRRTHMVSGGRAKPVRIKTQLK